MKTTHRLFLALTFFLLLPVAADAQASNAKPAGAESAVRAVLDAQVAAWNAGKLEDFMAGYWRSPKLTFFSGGRKMAGFATGVIDSFQYYGAAIALPVTGWLIKHYGWGTWYPTMAGFGVIGGCAMLLVMRKQKLLKAKTSA